MNNLFAAAVNDQMLSDGSERSAWTHAMPEVVFQDSQGRRPVNLSSHMLSKRRVAIFGEIDDDAANNIVAELLYLSEEDEEELITILINSPGGSINAGLLIYDTMKALESKGIPVDVYAAGMAASMAAILLAGGPKGHRFILPHSKVMIHEPLMIGGVGGSASTIKTTAESILKTKAVINDLLAADTGKTVKEIDEAVSYDHFFTAQEAIDFGLCDEIRNVI